MQQSKTTSPSIAFAWLVCSLGMVFYFYEFLLRIAPSMMETQMREYFNISAASFGTVVGLFYFAYTPMQLFVGAAVDLYGVRKILTVATLLCAAGTYIFGHTSSLWFAGSGRFLIGLGSSFAFVAALKLASVWLPANRFATFTGIVSSLGMLGGMVGDLGITSLVERFGWQHTMMYGVIFGIILAPLIALIVRDQPPNKPVERLEHKQLFKEYLKIIRNRQIWMAGLIACMLYLALSAFAEIWGIPYLRSAFGFSPQQAAFANSMVFCGWLIGGPLAGSISDRIRKRRLPIIVGSLVAAASISAVLYLPMTYQLVVVLLLIFGLATSTELICFAIGFESAPKEVGGTSLAFVNLLTMLGGFIFQPAIGKFLDLVWSGHMHNSIRSYTIHDYRLALTVLPIAMLISFILALTIRETYRAPEAGRISH